MKRYFLLTALILLNLSSIHSQQNYLWATGSVVGTYYNIAGYYTDNYMDPWPYSRSTMIPVVAESTTPWKYMESSMASQLRSCGVKTDGTIWFWTKNADPTKSPELIQFGSDTDWKQGALAHASAYGGYQGLKTDGTLWFMMDQSATPIQWGTDSDWDTIVGWNGDFMVAIKTDGTLWKLEAGINGDPISITQIGTDSDWVTAKITSNATPSLAIKSDGTLWEFDEDTELYEQIGAANDWKDITENGAIALKTNGTIWGKGLNNDGQLGLGHNNPVYEFTQIGTDSDWKHVSARNTTTYALKNDSTMWAWGNNTSYQLANGNNTNVNVPTQIGQDHSWLHVSSTTLGAFALRTYGYEGPGGSTAHLQNAFGEMVEVVPNPANEFLTLRHLPENSTICAVNALGVVHSVIQYQGDTEVVINTCNFEEGVYFITISSGNESCVKKLIVIH